MLPKSWQKKDIPDSSDWITSGRKTPIPKENCLIVDALTSDPGETGYYDVTEGEKSKYNYKRYQNKNEQYLALRREYEKHRISYR
jgi:hypothetical protein